MQDGRTVVVSYAQSVDGRIATLSGDSQWISGSRTLRLAHRLRRHADAVVVGIGTVLQDDPLLTCRLARCASPLRVIFDSRLRTPLDCRIARTAREHPACVLCLAEAAEDSRGAEKRRELESRGAAVWEIAGDGRGRLSVAAALERLEEEGFRRFLVEGGGGIITAFLEAGVVDRMLVVTAPLIIGRGVAAVGDLGIRDLGDALKPRRVRVRRMGPDVVWDMRFDASGGGA